MQTHDGISLFKGDCFDILPTLPSSSVQLFLCDLPYGVLNKQNPHAAWDKPVDLIALWKERKRIGTPNCAYVFFASGLFTHDVIESNRKDFKYTLVWDKKATTGFLNAKKQPLRRHEDFTRNSASITLNLLKGHLAIYAARMRLEKETTITGITILR